MNIEMLRKSEKLRGNLTLSPTMRIHFGDGKVVAMNRRERRRRGLYGVGFKAERSREV